MDESVTEAPKAFEGLFADMLENDYKIITRKEIGPDGNAILFDFSKIEDVDTRVIGCSARVFALDCSESGFTMELKAADRIKAFVRARLPKVVTGVKAMDEDGKEVPISFSWDEATRTVLVSYDSTDKVLFSADGFGKFGALDVEEDWDDEARRYFIGIVGKYGAQVQRLLKVAVTLDIQIICPLHGPVLTENLGHYISLYDTWSSYTPEEEGIVVAYTSVYGHTKEAVNQFVEKLKSKGCPKVVVYDLARDDMSQALSDAFRYSKLVLATTTYNAGIYPFMNDFITRLAEHNFQNRTVGLIENGSWAPLAAKVMKNMLSECKKINWLDTTVKIMSAVNQENRDQMEAMASELCKEYIAKNDELANKNDMTALFRIGYGLYVVTSNDGKKDNGLIVNTVTQLTDSPFRVAVNINKTNYSHHVIKQTGVMNVNCLSVEAPFSVFEQFGFQSGRSVDKFAGQKVNRSDNGLIFLDKYINAFMSLKVEQYVDLGTHGMFICSVTEARVVSDQETMSYTYYQKNVKPKPETEGKKGFVCKVCGYIYEGDELPEDYICPLCKHGAVDFEPIG